MKPSRAPGSWSQNLPEVSGLGSGQATPELDRWLAEVRMEAFAPYEFISLV